MIRNANLKQNCRVLQSFAAIPMNGSHLGANVMSLQAYEAEWSVPTARVDKPVESINACLASLLRSMHPDWNRSGCIRIGINSELDNNTYSNSDILICPQNGTPVALAAGFKPDWSMESDAKDLLGLQPVDCNHSIEQTVALKLPENFAEANQDELMDEIRNSEIEYCLYSLNREELDYPHRWPENGWITGDLSGLADLIELASFSESNLNKGLEILERSVSDASTILRQYYDGNSNVLDRIAKSLNQKDSIQTTRMAMAIVINAVLFHKSLVPAEGVKSFEQIWCTKSGNEFSGRKLCEHWDYIVQNINYLPIFQIALEVLEPLDETCSRNILKTLYSAAEELEIYGSASRHDFCGRLFQRLITDRKFLATFYTLPSSAALLAEVAIDRFEVDWSNADEIKSLKVADFACGTGALLNASMHAIIAKHNRVGGDGSKVHKHLVESVLVGTDIMPAATHLTASIIAGLFPENKFKHTSIYTLEYGRSSDSNFNSVSLGSLDLLDKQSIFPALNSGDRKITALKGNASNTDISQEIPDQSCDLVIMNPPFTNPTNHKSSENNLEVPTVPSFAGLENSSADQKRMSERLKKLYDKNMVGSGQAGLASNFFDIAHKKVKCPNGIIALVLPFTILRGESWSKVRQCLEKNYTDIVIFSIANAGQTEQAFSADTGMAEVMIVAKRVNDGERQPIVFVNLFRRPDSIAEAVLIAKSVIRKPNAPYIGIGNDVIANTFCGDYGCSGILHRNPAETAHRLLKGELVLPDMEQPLKIPIASIGSLGKIGLLYRDITGDEKKNDGTFRGPFEKVQPPGSECPTYPMLWSHDASVETRLMVDPDSEGRIRANCEKNAERVWNLTKSRLHSNRDFRLNSQPLAACMTEMETIGGTAWPNIILEDKNWDIPVLLWLNSTLGLISFWFQGSRQQLGRVRMTNSVLPNLSVLDARKLSVKQLSKAEEIFETIKNEEFLPANEAWRDETRQLLDQLVLVDLLGINKDIVDEGLFLIREQWCDEPSVHGGKSTAPKLNSVA